MSRCVRAAVGCDRANAKKASISRSRLTATLTGRLAGGSDLVPSDHACHLVVLASAARDVYRRLMDAVAPELVSSIEECARGVEGVEGVTT